MPSLALVVLTRNSEAVLGRCLGSARAFADAIYVLDTGSKDRTITIARKYGAEVHEMAWPGRFDVAVNALFDLVSESWTLRLDSDEWLLDGAGALIRSVLGAPQDLFYLTRVDYGPDGSASEMLLPRLVRTSLGIRVEGRIHEHFPVEQVAVLRSGELAAKLGHDGYASAIQTEKLRRNADLLREELEEHPDSFYYGVELGRTLMQLHDSEGAVIVNTLADRLVEQQHLEVLPDPLGGDLLASALDLVGDDDVASPRTDALLRLARGWCARLPGTTWAAAQLYLRRKQLREAMDCLLDLEDMLVRDDYWRVGAFRRGMLERATWQNLALVAHQLGRREVAKRNYERWLKLDPLNQQARTNLALL